MTAGFTVSEQKKTLTNTEGLRSYGRNFDITFNVALGVTESTIEGLVEIPNVGSVHPNNAAAWCRSVEVAVGKGTATAQCNFSEGTPLDEDPTLDTVEVSMDTIAYDQPIWKDINGDALLNSAGDPVKNLTKEATRRVFKIRTKLAAPPAWLATHEDGVNNATVTILSQSIPAGQAKIKRMHVGKEAARNGITFYPVEVDVHWYTEGFKTEYLDAGLREKINNVMIDIVSGDGGKVTQEVPLDGAGRKLDNPAPGTVTVLSKDAYNLVALADLPGVT